MQLKDSQKIGIFLVGFAGFFIFMGVLLLFDRGLLSVGNVLLVPGITMILGVDRTVQFCFQKHKIKGVVCFTIGFILVLFGWAFFGFIAQAFGFINLFGNFFPSVISFVKSLVYSIFSGFLFKTNA